MGLESLHFTSAALWDSSTASSAVGAVGSANPRTRYDALEIHRLARVTSHPLTGSVVLVVRPQCDRVP